MSESFWTRDHVAQRLSVPARALQLYEARGLVQSIQSADQGEGYGPAEIRRLWTIVTFQRDLGVNLAGVEAILQLSEQLEHLHQHMSAVSESLDQAIRELEDADDHGQA